MQIDEEILTIEREKLKKDFDTMKSQIQQAEIEIGSMNSNLNALHGAIQQTDKLIAMTGSNKGVYHDDRQKKEQEKK